MSCAQNKQANGPFDFVKGVMFYTPMQGFVPLLDMTKNALVRGIAAFGMPNLLEPPAPQGRDDEVYYDWPEGLTHMLENLIQLTSLLGERVSQWANLPKSGYEKVITYENSTNLRKLLRRHGLNYLEQGIGTQLFYKNEECRGITFATVWPVSFKGEIYLSASVCYVMPEVNQFKAESVVEELDLYSMRERWKKIHGNDDQWRAYMALWERNAIKQCSESFDPKYKDLKGRLIETKTIENLASEPNAKIVQMSLQEKQELGLIIQKRFATLHEIGHTAIQRLIDKPDLTFAFFNAFKKNPGMLTQHGIIKGIGGDNAELMVWQAFNESWCNKFALYLLTRDAAGLEQAGQKVDNELLKLLYFFQGELSDEEAELYEKYLFHLISLKDKVLIFSKETPVDRSIILRATQVAAAFHVPQTPEGLKKLFISLSFWKSLIAGIFMGLGVGLCLQSNALGFIIAGAEGIV